VPEARVVDGKAKELAVTIRLFYPVKGDIPKGLEVQLWFTDKQITMLKPDKFPLTVKVPLPPLGEFKGLDRKLYFMVEAGREIRRTAIGISQIDDFRARLDKVNGAPVKKEGDTVELATARRRVGLVGRASGGGMGLSFPPTDLPYAGLLANAEAMLDGKPFFTHDRPGQFWMTVPVGPGSVADCRVFVPKGLDPKKPVPVVFALHGEGVDENMFFESYGAGQVVKECQKRGWVLVAPRGSHLAIGLDAPPVLNLVEKLRERYPIDPKRVFLVGHSVGATRALDLAQAAPDKFAAVAVLAGGGKLTNPAVFTELPVFIGVGEKDALALPAARALNKALGSKAKKLTYKEYSDVEHLVIVREALPDVFAMFDEAMKQP
jgi:predicted esterase